MLPTKFQVSWPFGSGEKKKRHGDHLGFPIGTILVKVDLQVTPMLPSELQVNWPINSGEEPKMDFQDSRHGGHL